jgi:hypothetical protein
MLVFLVYTIVLVDVVDVGWKFLIQKSKDNIIWL